MNPTCDPKHTTKRAKPIKEGNAIQGGVQHTRSFQALKNQNERNSMRTKVHVFSFRDPTNQCRKATISTGPNATNNAVLGSFTVAHLYNLHSGNLIEQNKITSKSDHQEDTSSKDQAHSGKEHPQSQKRTAPTTIFTKRQVYKEKYRSFFEREQLYFAISHRQSKMQKQVSHRSTPSKRGSRLVPLLACRSKIW